MKVRFKNGDVGEFMSWVVVERQIYAMVLRYGKFQAWAFSCIETTHEPADHSGEPDITKPLPEPDYKQAYDDLVSKIGDMKKEIGPPGFRTSNWKGKMITLCNLLSWIDEHNPKGGE